MHGSCMGKVNVVVKLTNTDGLGAAASGLIPESPVRRIEVEFLVDTGMSMICLSAEMIEQIGLRKSRDYEMMTANCKVMRSVYSSVEFEVMGRAAAQEVMEMPSGTPPLLGYLPREILDLYPNPGTQQLEDNPEHGGRWIVDLL